VRAVHELGKLDDIGTVVGLELGQASVLPRLLPNDLHPLGREQRTAALVEACESEYGAQVSLTGDVGDDVERESSEGAERALFRGARETRSAVISSRSSCKWYRLTLIFLLGAGLAFDFFLAGFRTSAEARKARELTSSATRTVSCSSQASCSSSSEVKESASDSDTEGLRVRRVGIVGWKRDEETSKMWKQGERARDKFSQLETRARCIKAERRASPALPRCQSYSTMVMPISHCSCLQRVKCLRRTSVCLRVPPNLLFHHTNTEVLSRSARSP
jgi:hypothetical protein